MRHAEITVPMTIAGESVSHACKFDRLDPMPLRQYMGYLTKVAGEVSTSVSIEAMCELFDGCCRGVAVDGEPVSLESVSWLVKTKAVGQLMEEWHGEGKEPATSSPSTSRSTVADA